jgi:phospholipid transport system transporter-binding protein
MIEAEGGRLHVGGPLTMANAGGLLEAGRSALQAGELVIDFAGVEEVDSTALAVMLGWLRAAEILRSTLKFDHIPPAVESLAELYGVSDLLPRA